MESNATDTNGTIDTIKTFDRQTYMNEYMREYRKQNIDKIAVKVKCNICDCYYKKNNKSHHLRSKKHELNDLRKKVTLYESKNKPSNEPN